MDDNRRDLGIAAAVVFGLLGIVAGAVRGCDNATKERLEYFEASAKIQVECLRGGGDPLACEKMSAYYR